MADAGIRITEDNTQEILKSLSDAMETVLTKIGLRAEKYAKALCPVGTPESTGKKGYMGSTLRNSITFVVDGENGSLTIGSEVKYAPYVELGTGPNFDPPPEWLEYFNQAKKGAGIKKGGYVRPRPYLRPAIEDHADEYKAIMESDLS